MKQSYAICVVWTDGDQELAHHAHLAVLSSTISIRKMTKTLPPLEESGCLPKREGGVQ